MNDTSANTSESAPSGRVNKPAKTHQSLVRKIISKLASIQIGVVVIVTLGGLIAWGTIVEAQYNDAVAAQKIVYHSIWMFLTMGMLSISLIAVMLDRWPWKARHTGFVLAHIGILTILAGSLITKYFGIDGSMAFSVGDSSKLVAVSETEIAVWASFADGSPTNIYKREVDFFSNRPSEEKPYRIELPNGHISVVQYYPYAFRQENTVESALPGAGSAIRFQLQNARVSLTEWLVQSSEGREVSKNLGPAEVILAAPTGSAFPIIGKNALVFIPKPGNPDEVNYEIYTASQPGKVKKGVAKAGDTVETGWMGLTLRVLKYMPKAKQEVTFKQTNAKTELSNAAVEVEYVSTQNGETTKNRQWMSANSMMKFFSDQAAYIVTYGNRRQPLDFDLTLKDFRVGRYPGTMRAASYESLVEVPGRGEILISMNEPLKHNGYTFYQASFAEDEQGRTSISILSVNRDPGRWIKYLGSLIIVLGTMHLFYWKSIKKKQTKKPAA